MTLVVKLVFLSVQCFESRMPSYCCKHSYVVAYLHEGKVFRISTVAITGPCLRMRHRPSA